MQKPSLVAILLGCAPILGMCLTVPLWDRIDPMLLGIPFNLFWLTLWILLTPVFMYGAYVKERRAELLHGQSSKGVSR